MVHNNNKKIAPAIKNINNIKDNSAKNTKSATNNRQKVLLPTLKEQQRYVVYRVLPQDARDTQDMQKTFADFGKIHNNILSQCNSMLGIFDGGKAGLMSAKYNADKMSGIVRVNNKYVDKLKVCLGLIKTIDGKTVTIDCIYVSGMLNKAAEKIGI
jgi:RNase P/RNase MRP subunit POP5